MSPRTLAAAAAAVTLSLATFTLAADGAQVFAQQCARCHGANGTADTPMGKAVKAAVLAGDVNVQRMTEAQVVQRVRTNEKHPQMIRSLSDEKLDAVVPFVKQLADAR